MLYQLFGYIIMIPVLCVHSGLKSLKTCIYFYFIIFFSKEVALPALNRRINYFLKGQFCRVKNWNFIYFWHHKIFATYLLVHTHLKFASAHLNSYLYNYTQSHCYPPIVIFFHFWHTVTCCALHQIIDFFFRRKYFFRENAILTDVVGSFCVKILEVYEL